MEANTKRRIIEKELSYNLMNILGRGSYGSFVFVGEFGENKQLVAVKRFQWNYIKPDSIEKFKTTFVSSKLKDTNVLHYLAIEKGPDFLFIVTELCAGTLKHLVEGKYQGPPIGDIDERGILFQVTSGLNYLHSSNIFHRDIKPSNILIFFPSNEAAKIGNNEKVLFKLADFGIISTLITDERDFRKKKEYRPDASLSGARGKSPKNWELQPVSCAPCDLVPGYKIPSDPPLAAALKEYVDPHGTQGWIPPELYDSDTDYDSKVDIFALGCVFGYTLSGGKNLFGDSPLEQAIRIMHKKPITLALANLKKPFCDDATIFELIASMVKMEPNDRPSSHAVLKNQFFLKLDTGDTNDK